MQFQADTSFNGLSGAQTVVRNDCATPTPASRPVRFYRGESLP